MASTKVTHVSDDTFQSEVLDSQVPVLLDFTATWCGPCQRIAPLIDALAEKQGGKIKVCKIDIDHNPKAPMKYGIRGVPTLMLFDGGQKVGQHVGALNGAQLDSFVSQVLF